MNSKGVFKSYTINMDTYLVSISLKDGYGLFHKTYHSITHRTRSKEGLPIVFNSKREWILDNISNFIGVAKVLRLKDKVVILELYTMEEAHKSTEVKVTLTTTNEYSVVATVSINSTYIHKEEKSSFNVYKFKGENEWTAQKGHTLTPTIEKELLALDYKVDNHFNSVSKLQEKHDLLVEEYCQFTQISGSCNLYSVPVDDNYEVLKSNYNCRNKEGLLSSNIGDIVLNFITLQLRVKGDLVSLSDNSPMNISSPLYLGVSVECKILNKTNTTKSLQHYDPNGYNDHDWRENELYYDDDSWTDRHPINTKGRYFSIDVPHTEVQVEIISTYTPNTIITKGEILTLEIMLDYPQKRFLKQ